LDVRGFLAMRIQTLLTIALFAFATLKAEAQGGITEPGGDASGAQMALTSPFEFAWKLFLFVNHPARTGVAGQADETKKLGEMLSQPVVWESWALASGSSAQLGIDNSEVYKLDGSKPAEWDKLVRPQGRKILDQNLEQLAFQTMRTGIRPRFDATLPAQQEVRMNRATYDFVRDNGMYSRDGLVKLLDNANSNRGLIKFLAGSKEVKAQWHPILEVEKSRYLWREVEQNGQRVAFGLVALHIITKDLPNWFWADFGHVDCEKGINACDTERLRQFGILPPSQVQEVALTDPVDPTTRDTGSGNPPTGKDGVRNETVGTVWENYILRGTQTDFTTAWGNATILSNPVIENSFQKSSCMSCHARASVGVTKTGANRLDTLSPGDPTLGSPSPALFGSGEGVSDPGKILYLQTDFIWSAPFRAKWEKK
jgi:hypothetical protein